MDLIVNLYDVNNEEIVLKDESIKIKRVLSPNSDLVISFITKNFSEIWASEVKASLYQNNPKCFIAVKENQIIGFACYDATAKGYFGPLGVLNAYRGLNIAKALVIECLLAMRYDGYGYAVIGMVEDHNLAFYSKCANFTIVNAEKTVYSRLI